MEIAVKPWGEMSVKEIQNLKEKQCKHCDYFQRIILEGYHLELAITSLSMIT